VSERVAWETPVLFAEVLVKTDPLSEGLRANARLEGYGRLFLSSRFAVSARVA